MNKKLLGRIFAWFGHIMDAQQVVAAVLPSSALALLTSWLAHMADVPWHLILFYGTGVFAFCMWAAARITELARENSYKHRVLISGIRPVHVIYNKDDKLFMIQIGADIQNGSKWPIYFKMKIYDYLLQNRGNQDAVRIEGQNIIPPNGVVPYLLPLIKDITPGALGGSFMAELTFGRKADNLNCTLKQGFVLQGYTDINSEKPTLMLNHLVKTMEYS